MKVTDSDQVMGLYDNWGIRIGGKLVLVQALVIKIQDIVLLGYIILIAIINAS